MPNGLLRHVLNNFKSFGYDCNSTFFFLAVDICKKCDINAKCINDTCVCVEGFYGNGFTCRSKDKVNFLEKLYRN